MAKRTVSCSMQLARAKRALKESHALLRECDKFLSGVVSKTKAQLKKQVEEWRGKH
jgi:hypothetical protein